MAEGRFTDGCSTPGGDVSEMFQKIGAKLGWFEFRDIDSALQSLSKSTKKKSTRSKVNKVTKKNDKIKNKENSSGVGGADPVLFPSASKKHSLKKSTVKSCEPLGETSASRTCNVASEAKYCEAVHITSTQKIHKLKPKKLLKEDYSNKKFQGDLHVTSDSVFTNGFVTTSIQAADRHGCENRDNLVFVSPNSSDLDSSVMNSKNNSFVIAGRPSLCIGGRTALSDSCSEDVGIPVGESTRIDSSYSIRRLPSITRSCEGSESNTSLKFDDSENDSYNLLNIGKANNGQIISKPLLNDVEEIKNLGRMTGNAKDEFVAAMEENASSSSDSSYANVNYNDDDVLPTKKHTADNENLYVTCCSDSNSSPCLQSEKKTQTTEQYKSVNSSCSDTSSYEVVDASTQMSSDTGGFLHDDGESRNSDKNTVFLTDVDECGILAQHSNSLPCLQGETETRTTEEYRIVDSSCSNCSSYEVVDVSTQVPSDTGLHDDGELKKSEKNTVFLSDVDATGITIAQFPKSSDSYRMGNPTNGDVHSSTNLTKGQEYLGCSPDQKVCTYLSDSSDGSLPDLYDNFENGSVQQKDARRIGLGSETDTAQSEEKKVEDKRSNVDTIHQWRSPQRLDDSSDDELEAFFNKIKKPVVNEKLENEEDSLGDFIADDDELSSESDDAMFHVNTAREITVPENKKKNRFRKETTAVQFISDSSDDDEHDCQRVLCPSVPQTTTHSNRVAITSVSRVTESNFINNRKPSTPTLTYSFLRSLSLSIQDERSDPEARRFKKFFKKTKEELTKKLFDIYNSTVFDKQLPADFPIIWNTRLLRTAGYCTYKQDRSGKTVRIELSTKVCDTTERVRDTLIHELCHAAVWLLNGTRDGHGPYWKYWARKANQTHREIPIIERCHSYSITTRFAYQCSKCGYSIGRHSKSLDTTKKVCGHCRGQFVLVDNKMATSSVDGLMTPKTPRTPNKFALFVKDNYGEVKKSREKITHGECMKLLGQQFAQKNKISD